MGFRYRLATWFRLLAAAGILCSAQSGHCEWPDFSRADIGIGFYWEQRDILLQGDAITDDELRVGIEIAQDGYWVDPRIVSFNYYLRPTYSWREYTPLGKQDGELNNYRISVDFLRGAIAPVEASLRSSLSNNEYKATLAGDTVSRVQEHAAEFLWKFQPFPLEFAALHRDFYRKSTTAYSNSTVERHDLRRKFTIRGRSSKLSMRLEHETSEDLLGTSFNDFQWDNADVSHIFNWGRNSSLRTRYEYRNRERDKRYVSNVFSQDYRVQHTDRVNSALDYRYESATGDQDADILDAHYQITHQLYRNLNTSGYFYFIDRNSDFEDYTKHSTGIRFTYQKDFSGFGVRLGANIRQSSIDSIAKRGFQEVIDQGYTVPPSGNLLLDDNFIVEESVVITNLSGVFLYVRGIDYELLSFGRGRLLVTVIPGGEIEVGQSVLISYSAALAPSGQYDEKTHTYNASLSRGNLYFSLSGLRSDTDLKSGFLPPELAYRRERHSDLSYSWNNRNATFQISVKNDLWRTPDLDLSTVSLDGSTSFYVRQSLNASLSLRFERSTSKSTNLDFMTTAIDTLDTDSTSLRFDLEWRVTGNLTIKPSVIGWARRYRYRELVTRSFDEEILSAEVELDYQLGKFSTNLRFFYNDRQIDRTLPNPDYSRTDDGFRLTVRRSF